MGYIEKCVSLCSSLRVGSLIDGLNIVGYRIFADGHIRVRREIREKIKKKIHRGHKMGLTYQQIFRATSSILGTMMHADSIHFMQKYHMETREKLGAKINKRNEKFYKFT